MTEQVACIECRQLTSAIAAPRMKGLCLKCWAKKNTNKPLRLLYASLIDRVHRSPDGFDRLSEPEKIFYAVTKFENEINNGGFDQYFFNSSGSYFSHAETGLAILGATVKLELLRQAKMILFPTGSVPTDREERIRLLPIAPPDAPEPEWELALNKLDRQFYSDSDSLAARLKEFALQQGLISREIQEVDCPRNERS